MPYRNLLRVHDSHSSEFSKSQDFLNIDVPPTPQQSPDVSQLNVSESTPRNATSGLAQQRRSSTNYLDALDVRRNSFDEPSTVHVEPKANDSHECLFSKMSLEKTKHGFQSKDCARENNANVDMGSHLQKFKSLNLKNKMKGKARSKDDTKNYSYNTNSSSSSLSLSNKNNSSDGSLPHELEENNAELPPEEQPQPQPQPQLPHFQLSRQSSFEYEDFKKHIYNRLKMFRE